MHASLVNMHGLPLDTVQKHKREEKLGYTDFESLNSNDLPACLGPQFPFTNSLLDIFSRVITTTVDFIQVTLTNDALHSSVIFL